MHELSERGSFDEIAVSCTCSFAAFGWFRMFHARAHIRRAQKLIDLSLTSPTTRV